MAEPLLSRDRLLGTIVVRDKVSGAAFLPEDQQLLRLFAVQATIAIENARLYADLKRSYETSCSTPRTSSCARRSCVRWARWRRGSPTI
jgi:hypothetical protein